MRNTKPGLQTACSPTRACPGHQCPGGTRSWASGRTWQPSGKVSREKHEAIRALLKDELNDGPSVLEEVIEEIEVQTDRFELNVRDFPVRFNVEAQGVGSGPSYRAEVTACTAIPFKINNNSEGWSVASALGEEVFKMKEKKKTGITRSAVMNVLAQKLMAGSSLESIIKIEEYATPKKDLKAKRKRLEAEKHWTVGKDTVQFKDGIVLDQIASWVRRVVIHYNGKTYSGRIFNMDCAGRRTIYFVPHRHVDKLTALEGIELNEKQRQLLLRMANTLDNPLELKSWVMRPEHPVLVDLWENLECWQKRPLDRNEMTELLRREPWLWHVYLTALPVHLLPLLTFPEEIPIFGENLVVSDREDQEVLMQAIRAVTFVNASGLVDAGPIWCGRSLKALESSPERAVLIKGTAATSRDVIAMLEERDRLMKCGSSVPAPNSVPVLLSSSLIFSDLAVNHIIPSGLMRLSEKDQDLLRTAMAHLLTPDWVEWIIENMDRLSTEPEGYRRPGTRVRRSVLLCGMALSWFPDHWLEVASEAETLLRNENEQIDQERKEIEEAIELLTNPERYAALLLDIPASKQEAEEALITYAGFKWTPTKGKILERSNGKPLVVFRKSTICRLLGWQEEDSRRLETLMLMCEQRGVLLSRRQKVTFHDGLQLTMLAFDFSERGGDSGD